MPNRVLTFLFLIDPLGNLPYVLILLKSLKSKRRWQVLLREMCIALGVMLGTAYYGDRALIALGISQAALHIAGGIALISNALQILSGKSSVKEQEEPFIIPIAMPLVAGPGVVTAILLADNPVIPICIAWLITLAIFAIGEWIQKGLGARGIAAVERIVGIVLILFAVQMTLDGISLYFKHL